MYMCCYLFALICTHTHENTHTHIYTLIYIYDYIIYDYICIFFYIRYIFGYYLVHNINNILYITLTSKTSTESQNFAHLRSQQCSLKVVARAIRHSLGGFQRTVFGAVGTREISGKWRL